MEPLISVIVPVYNAANSLNRCVDSLLAQTCGNIEIILVDDGSSDGSGSICAAYAHGHKNITAILKKNGGVSSARNAGLAAARGLYLGFVDSDDWVKPEMYSALLGAIEEQKTSISACAYIIHRHNGVVLDGMVAPETPSRLELEPALRSLIAPNGIQGFLCNKLFDRALLTQIGNGKIPLLDERIHICEDLIYVSRCIETAGCIAYDNRPMYVYCVQGYNATADSNLEKRLSEFIALEQLTVSWTRLSAELGAYMKQKYTNTAYYILRAAAAMGNRADFPVLRGHLKRYLRSFLGLKTVSPKRKMRVILAFAFPDLENRISKIIRSRRPADRV